jgi:hypothetical protein
MDSPFPNSMAEGISGAEVRTIRISYMAARRTSGKCHAPDREVALIGSRQSVLAKLRFSTGFIVDIEKTADHSAAQTASARQNDH